MGSLFLSYLAAHATLPCPPCAVQALAAIPPEALAGLSEEDAAAIAEASGVMQVWQSGTNMPGLLHADP